MKVSIIGSRGYPYVYSGYETFVKELSERLVKKNIEVTVYCHKNLFSSFPKQVNNIKLVYVPTIETKILSQFIHSFFSIFHACIHKADVILAVNAANGTFGFITKIFGKKTMINVDGLEWLRPKWKGLGAKYFKFAAKLATKFYDVIVTDAEAMRKVYLEEFKKNSVMIAYGANLQYSKNPSLINQFNLKKDEYYLIVGRLIPDNNADVILTGFINGNSSKKLVIVGDVPYKDEYASIIKSKATASIIFTGYIRDDAVLSELYHNCFAYFHGHEFGGTNPTLLKAMACGTAILALDTVFNREMLCNGEFGLFFSKEPSSISSLINICEGNTGKLALLKQNARNGITEKYNWDNITDKYINVMQQLILKK